MYHTKAKLCPYYNEQQKLFSEGCMDGSWEWDNFGEDNRAIDKIFNDHEVSQLNRFQEALCDVMHFTDFRV